MKHVLFICFLFSTQVMACGPSPQKVIQKKLIQQPPEVVWALIGDFEKIPAWHPDVIKSELENRVDGSGNETVFRVLTLRGGGKLIQRMRETTVRMKIGTVVEQGDMAFSNYSDAMTISPGEQPGETLVTWTGRFSNKANRLIAPEGQDNKAAISAVERFYKQGLNGLKAHMELMMK